MHGRKGEKNDPIFSVYSFSFVYFVILISDQVNFMGVQLVIRSILKFLPYKIYQLLLKTAVLPQNLFDPDRSG